MFHSLIYRVCSAYLVVVLLAGCGSSGPEIASVKGTITLDGKPLPNATIVFIPPEGRPAGAKTNAEGKYELNFSNGRKGTMPGLNKIRLTTLSEASQDENGNAIPGSKEIIPMQYNQMSTLEFLVEPGKQNIADFALESKGKIQTTGY